MPASHDLSQPPLSKVKNRVVGISRPASLSPSAENAWFLVSFVPRNYVRPCRGSSLFLVGLFITKEPSPSAAQ